MLWYNFVYAVVECSVCTLSESNETNENESHRLTTRRIAYEFRHEYQQNETILHSPHHLPSIDLPNNNYGHNKIIRIPTKNNISHNEISINFNEIVCFRRRYSGECISMLNASIPTMYNLFNPNGKRICQYRYVLDERNQPKLCDTISGVAKATIAMGHVLQNSIERHDNYFMPTEHIFVINGINGTKCNDKSDQHFAVFEIAERVLNNGSQGACNRNSSNLPNKITPSNSLALKHQRFRK